LQPRFSSAQHQTHSASVITAVITPKPKTRYIVTPDPLQNWMSNNLPKRLVDRTIAKQLGLVE